MAEVIDEVGADEAIVERKIVPVHRNRFSLLALLMVLAFVAACAVVFFGRSLGISGSALPPATVTGTTAPTPPAPTP